MTNHFHLVVRTPMGNLIYGMKWLQSTFANRYHRFRKAHGKLFQGRYKSLMVEESGYLGSLLHYVHLNPVRAKLCEVAELKHYRWSSYWYLHNPRKRLGFMKFAAVLDSAGGLKDTSRGRQSYEDYLTWLSTDEVAQKEQAFGKMTRGWALGSAQFKEDLLKTVGVEAADGSSKVRPHFEGRDLREANELRWQESLRQALSEAGKSAEDIQQAAKSAAWKVMIACALKRHTSAPNPWIARELNMGVPHGVSRYVGKFRATNGEAMAAYQRTIARITE